MLIFKAILYLSLQTQSVIVDQNDDTTQTIPLTLITI